MQIPDLSSADSCPNVPDGSVARTYSTAHTSASAFLPASEMTDHNMNNSDCSRQKGSTIL